MGFEEAVGLSSTTTLVRFTTPIKAVFFHPADRVYQSKGDTGLEILRVLVHVEAWLGQGKWSITWWDLFGRARKETRGGGSEKLKLVGGFGDCRE